MYNTFGTILSQSHSMAEVLEKCPFESYVWDATEFYDGATTYSISLIGEYVTINVLLDESRRGGMLLDRCFQLISHESDDRNGFIYGRK